MTLRELQSEICALGFDQCAELNLRLIYATARSLSEISRSARVIRGISITIPKGSMEPASRVEESRNGGDTLSPRASVDMRELLTDFLAFAQDVTDRYGRTIKGARLGNGKITLPPDFYGEINVVYYRTMSVPSLTTPDAPIDIPDEYEPLLPLLTASYILLDTDTEKAEFYRSAYLKAAEELRGICHSRAVGNYANVDGWA